MAVQFKWNNVIEDDEDGLHVKYQSISYEYSWKFLEKYVINVVKQSVGLLYKSATLLGFGRQEIGYQIHLWTCTIYLVLVMAIPVVEANIFVVEMFVFLYNETEKSSLKV